MLYAFIYRLQWMSYLFIWNKIQNILIVFFQSFNSQWALLTLFRNPIEVLVFKLYTMGFIAIANSRMTDGYQNGTLYAFLLLILWSRWLHQLRHYFQIHIQLSGLLYKCVFIFQKILAGIFHVCKLFDDYTLMSSDIQGRCAILKLDSAVLHFSPQVHFGNSEQILTQEDICRHRLYLARATVHLGRDLTCNLLTVSEKSW